MIGTNNATMIPINGEQNTRGLVGVAYRQSVAFPWRLAVYGHQMNVSNKPSEHNIMNMPNLTAVSVLPRLKQYNGQAARINSASIVFPSGG